MKLRNKLSDEKGAISLFTVLSMLFFIAFALGAFTMISRRNQMQEATQASLKEIYTQNGDALYGTLSGEDSSNLIRIDTQEKYFKIFSGEEIVQDTVSLTASTTAQYIFDDNISIDLDVLKGFSGEATNSSKYVLNDYLLYNGATNIQTNGKTVIYNYDPGVGHETKHYVLAAHALGSSYAYDDGTNHYDKDQFCVLKDVMKKYSSASQPSFLLYYRNKNDTTFKVINTSNNSGKNTIIKSNNSNNPNITLANVVVMDDLPTDAKEFFLFLEIDYNQIYEGSPLGQFAKPGQYIDFSVFKNKNVTPADGIQASYDSTEPQWRILSSEKNSDGSYTVKIVSTGVPLLLEKGTRTMNDIMIDTNLNFDSTDFKLEDGTIVKGQDLKNKYAESIRNINYEDISHLMVGAPDIAAARNVAINQSGLFADRKNATGTVINENYINWTDNRTNLIANGGSYLVSQTYKEGSTDYLLNLQRSTMQKVPSSEITSSYGIRPVITLVKSVIITSGNGSKANPYKIDLKDGYDVSTIGTGAYISYPIEYANFDSAVTDDGWRILDIKKDSNNKDIIRIISGGVPVKYDVPRNEQKTNTIDKLVNHFSETTLKTRKYDVTGSNFIDSRFASDVKVLMDADIAGVYNGSATLVTDDSNVNAISLIDKYKSNGVDLQNTAYTNWNSLQKGLFHVLYPYCFFKTSNIYMVQGTGVCATWSSSNGLFIRPVVTLKAEVEIYGGSGTKDDPYRIRVEDNSGVSEPTTGETRYLTTSAYAGQYVKYDISYTNADDNNTKTGWRILSMSTEGDLDTIKLVSAGSPLNVTGSTAANITLPDASVFDNNKSRFINTNVAQSVELFGLNDFLAYIEKTRPTITVVSVEDRVRLANDRLVEYFGDLSTYAKTTYDRELIDNGSSTALFGNVISVTSGGTGAARIEDVNVYLKHTNSATNVNVYENQAIYGRVIVTLQKHKYEIVSGTGTELNPFVIK